MNASSFGLRVTCENGSVLLTGTQDYFLKSSRPLEALDLRKDLKHWDEAMNLAKKLDATQVPRISKEYGQSLEMRKEYESALKAFEEALSQGELDHDSEFVCQVRFVDFRQS